MEGMVIGLVRFFYQGGALVFYLLLCGCGVAAIVLERGWYFWQADAGRDFAVLFGRCLIRRQYTAAWALAADGRGEAPELLRSFWHLARSGGPRLRPFIELQVGLVRSRLQRHLSWLTGGAVLALILGMPRPGRALDETLAAIVAAVLVAGFALAAEWYFGWRARRMLREIEQCCLLLDGQKEQIARDGTPGNRRRVCPSLSEKRSVLI